MVSPKAALRDLDPLAGLLERMFTSENVLSIAAGLSGLGVSPTSSAVLHFGHSLSRQVSSHQAEFQTEEHG
jgi:hypothetical protein